MDVLYNGGTFTQEVQNIALTATKAGTYYLHVLSENTKGYRLETISEAITFQGAFSATQSFLCNNAIQTYTIPETGVYKLEVWGAQGGGLNGSGGGLGGYSIGYKQLTKDTILYIGVGGQGGATIGYEGSTPGRI